MKRPLFAIVGLLFLFSCNYGKHDAAANNSDGNNYTAEASRNAEHNKEIYRAIETGNVSKLDSFVTEDIIDHEENNGKDIVGLDSLKYYLGTLHNYFDGLKMEVVSGGTSLDKTYYFSLIRMRGKAKENPWGVPVGMDVDNMIMDVFKIRNGKNSEHWSFTSQKDINEMMNERSK
jgi:predicted SnoaL-like aldol condensation-catalyzing enzyme